MDKVRFTIHTVTGRDVISDVIDLDAEEEGVVAFLDAIGNINKASSISFPGGGFGYAFNPQHIVYVKSEPIDES